MRQPKSISSPVVDIPHLMEVICGYQKEVYPFERYVAMLTFTTWLHSPAQAEIALQARVVAAALVIQAIHNGRLPVSPKQREAKINSIADRAFRPLDAA
jgi:hypothetical protein